MKYTAILREKGSNYYVKRVDSDYSSKASYAKDCRANGYYVGGIFTDAEIDLIVNGLNSDDLETWRKSIEFSVKFSERLLSCFTDGCPDISEPKETAEPEQKEECTQETEHSGNWFDDVFLTSLFEKAEPLKPFWLTQKQTSVCIRNMEYHCTKDCNGSHEWYTWTWAGRTIELSYSKKNQCGSIVFGRNAEEQAEADKQAEEERKEQKNELFGAKVESIQNGTQRTIERTLKRYNQLKEDLESMQEDIADGFYTEDEPCYLKAKEEFEWLKAVIKESGLDKPKAEPERKWGLFTDYIGKNLVETFRTEKEAKKALKSYGFMKHSEAWVEEVEEKETCRPPPDNVWNQGTRNESKYQLKGLIEWH